MITGETKKDWEKEELNGKIQGRGMRRRREGRRGEEREGRPLKSTSRGSYSEINGCLQFPVFEIITESTSFLR